MRLTREAARISVLGAGLLLASLAPAAAQDPHAEIFTGLDASNNATTGYLGAGYAFGKGLYAPGWRVRAVGALGRYDYQGTLFGAGADLGTTFDGDASYGAALLGYQFRSRTLIVKLFAGVEAEDQRISPRDPANSVQGNAVGLKLAAESWLDVSPRWFLSVDASYGTAFQQYWSLARAGYRLGPRFSLGIEGGALGNEEYDAGRGGGFLRADLHAIELTLSGGFTGNYLEDEPSGYMSLGVYRAF
ncbi:cellulose biosynthesis protein BcsS [Methyloceanibacter sp.]|uniref:cellulose biosynthesis protein BcsS n=1 Tax=Methyloceanibacter sp. TaxID=1965321 RepID=UPI003D6DA5A7